MSAIDHPHIECKYFDEWQPIWNQRTNRFSSGDVDGDMAVWIKRLEESGFIEAVDREKANGSYRKQYEWTEEGIEAVEAYLEDRDELPCGCRKHLHNPRNTHGYTCKYCGQWYDKQTMQAVLEGSA